MHKINLNILQKEVGIESAEGIGNFLEMKNPKGVYNWSKDKSTYGSRPSYNDIIRLLQKGATVETLFGVEYAKMHPAPSVVPPDVACNSEFQKGLQKAIEAKVNEAVAAALKAKGLL